MHRDCQSLELEHLPSCHPLRSASSRGAKYSGKQHQRTFLQTPQGGTTQLGGIEHLSTMAIPIMGSLCISQKQEMPSLLLSSGMRAQLQMECISNTMVRTTNVCISFHSSLALSPKEDQTGQSVGDPPLQPSISQSSSFVFGWAQNLKDHGWRLYNPSLAIAEKTPQENTIPQDESDSFHGVNIIS